MARGGNESDEERHDRFRSERNCTSLKSMTTTLGQAKRELPRNLSLSGRSTYEARHSQSHRSRDRSPDRKARNRDDLKTWSKEDDRLSSRRLKDGHDRSRYRRRSRDSTERRSDSPVDHDHREEKKCSKRSKRNRTADDHLSENRVDTFAQRFERRRDSSTEEVVDNTIILRDDSPSPDRSKHKKRKSGDKEKRREKRKDKKKKITVIVDRRSDSPRSVIVSQSPSDTVSSHQTDLPAESMELAQYGPEIPSKRSESSEVPSSSPEELLPGNRSSLPESSQKESDIYGPAAPPNCTVISDDEDDVDGAAGADPPEDKQPEVLPRVYGPSLPERAAAPAVDEEAASYGPALPPRLQSTSKDAEPTADDSAPEEGGGYGPLPPGMGGRTQEELEIRAALIKRQLEIKDDEGPKKREAWMLELPAARQAQLGLGPRKFRAREAPDMSDRTSWTDTPEQKKKKEELAKLGVDVSDEDDSTNSKLLGLIERDKEMEKRARQARKEERSLLKMHQKLQQKKKKKEEKERGSKKEERRPFNRELDLQTNKFDEAQKRSIIKKAQLLDSRFSRGETKYL